MALEEGRFFTGSISDRRHNADGLAEYCRDILTSGVWALGNNLRVTPYTDMNVSINYGKALVDGYPYRLVDNGSGLLILPVAAADAQPRIDRVVIRKDAAAQRIYAYIKKGLPAADPAPPALEQSETTYEISLVKILIAVGISEIISDYLTDERELVGLSKTLKLSNHEVGSYYWSDDPTSPAILFGGTWTRIKDVFPLAAGDIYAAGTTGGSSTVTLTKEQIPNLNIPLGIGGTIGYADNNDRAARMANCTNVDMVSFFTVGGGGGPHNNMPPYKAVYIWKRTA